MRHAAIGASAAILTILIAAGICPALAAESNLLVNEAVIDGPADVIWRLITTKEGMESWIVPHAEIDFRAGGLVRTNHDPAGRIGDANTITNRILALRPKQMVSIQVADTPDGIPFAQTIVGTRYQIFLQPLPGGKTRVRCEGRGFDGGPMGFAARTFMYQGGNVVLEKLRAAVARKTTGGAAKRR